MGDWTLTDPNPTPPPERMKEMADWLESIATVVEQCLNPGYADDLMAIAKELRDAAGE